MADKQFEQGDPFEMVGVALPQEMDDEALTEMACCFVEEFARMGYQGEKLMRLFRDPIYKGPHSVYRAKGESFVRALVDQVSPGVEQNHG